MVTKEVKEKIKVLYEYMQLGQKIQKCDLIIGCGCANLEIASYCSFLYHNGYGANILFAGGIGKITKNRKDIFVNSEAETYQKIALAEAVPPEHIFIETKSTNTGDNFRFSIPIIQQHHIPSESILIVHNSSHERRTLQTAKAIWKQKKLIVTSPVDSFGSYLGRIQKEEKRNISVLVGDIQRLIVYPQLGWMEETIVPAKVLETYQELKEMGYDDFIYSEEQLLEMIAKSEKKIEKPNLFG